MASVLSQLLLQSSLNPRPEPTVIGSKDSTDSHTESEMAARVQVSCYAAVEHESASDGLTCRSVGTPASFGDYQISSITKSPIIALNLDLVLPGPAFSGIACAADTAHWLGSIVR